MKKNYTSPITLIFIYYIQYRVLNQCIPRIPLISEMQLEFALLFLIIINFSYILLLTFLFMYFSFFTFRINVKLSTQIP